MVQIVTFCNSEMLWLSVLRLVEDVSNKMSSCSCIVLTRININNYVCFVNLQQNAKRVRPAIRKPGPHSAHDGCGQVGTLK